jgi:hypothetical protein
VQWSWGLDSHHDVNDPQRANKYTIRVQAHPQGPSRDVQKLTLNVLADQGVLPSTLAPELEAHARHLTLALTPTLTPTPTLTLTLTLTLARPTRATWPPHAMSARRPRMM